MKKTLLATAVAASLAATGAQAATVYDQDGTKLDVYGRIAMGVGGGGPEYNDAGQKIDNGPEFVDVYSRLGFNMSQQITSDLSAFGRLEWRFDGDERTGPSGNGNTGFKEVRQSYIGLKSAQYGTVQGGNFDSFYNQFVSLPFDVYIDRGLEFAGHPKQSRGDSIGYYTPDLSGFTVFLQGKMYSDRGTVEGVRDEGDVIAAQGGVKYEQGPVTVGLGFVDDVVRGGGNGEIMGGLIGSYAINDNVSVRLGYEGRENSDTRGGGYDTVGLGTSYSTGPWAFAADIYDVNPDGEGAEDRTSWALGSYYKVSSNFNVFLELQQADQQSITVNLDGLDSSVEEADGNDVYWLTGARYFF
ncbi:porin [Vreelandella aquamarina]